MSHCYLRIEKDDSPEMLKKKQEQAMAERARREQKARSDAVGLAAEQKAAEQRNNMKQRYILYVYNIIQYYIFIVYFIHSHLIVCL